MTMLLLYYLFLVSFSFLIFRNAFRMWKANGDFTLLITTLILFYFTLGGAFIFPADSYFDYKGSEIGIHYLPIFERLFTVYFDADYIRSCLYYAIFIAIFQYTYIYSLKYLNKKYLNTNNANEPKVVYINPYFVCALSLIFIFGSAYIMRKELYYAIANEKSIYIITRANKNSLYTIHQLCNEFSVLIPFIAYTFTIFKSGAFIIQFKNKRTSFYILLVTCIISSLYISMLGNRREILSGLVICSLIGLNYLANLNKKRFFIIFSFVTLLFLCNNIFRSRLIPHQLNAWLKLEKGMKMQEDLFQAKSLAGSLIFSNELFYAHFSMYGVLHKNVAITKGTSYEYLIKSLVPGFLSSKRPQDSYNYYAQAVNAVPGQIYTIHHATACYINFGFLGIILGALMLSSLFVVAQFIKFFHFKQSLTLLSILKQLIPFLICGQLVTFITAGPEAYKSMIFEGILIPVLLLWICSFNTSLKAK